MLVRCVTDRFPPTGDQELDRGTQYSITPGKEYVVLGMTVCHDELLFLIESEWQLPDTVPAALFEVVDDRVSDGWVFRHYSEPRLDFRRFASVFRAAEWGFPEMARDPDFWNAAYRESDESSESKASCVLRGELAFRTAQEKVRCRFSDASVEAFFWACSKVVSCVDEVAAVADLEALAGSLGMTVVEDGGVASVPVELLAVAAARLVSSGLAEAGDYRRGFVSWGLSPAGTAAGVMESYRGPEDLDWGYSIFFRPSTELRAAASAAGM